MSGVGSHEMVIYEECLGTAQGYCGQMVGILDFIFYLVKIEGHKVFLRSKIK